MVLKKKIFEHETKLKLEFLLQKIFTFNSYLFECETNSNKFLISLQKINLFYLNSVTILLEKTYFSYIQVLLDDIGPRKGPCC